LIPTRSFLILFFVALEPIDRKELFDKWSSITSEKYLEEKKKLDQNPAAVFIKLLDESVKTIRGARFDDFCRRFKNDSRFLKISSVKERQVFFVPNDPSLNLRRNYTKNIWLN
jgi:ABC-type Fe3+-hydroxamate transport system substrate-binding protein